MGLLVQMEKPENIAESSHFRALLFLYFSCKIRQFNTSSLRPLDGQILHRTWYRTHCLIGTHLHLSKPEKSRLYRLARIKQRGAFVRLESVKQRVFVMTSLASYLPEAAMDLW